MSKKKKGIKKIPHFQNSLIHKHFLDLNLCLQMDVHNVSVCTDKYNYSYQFGLVINILRNQTKWFGAACIVLYVSAEKDSISCHLVFFMHLKIVE